MTIVGHRIASCWFLPVGNEAAMDNEVSMIQCLIHLATTVSTYMHFGNRVQDTSTVSCKSTNKICNRTERIFFMKLSTHDKAKGTIREVKGAIKQKAGELTNDPDLAADGKVEKNAGKVQHFVGKVEKAVGE
jgi:uncharacterized protein YjbJ (UPF0337 family)